VHRDRSFRGCFDIVPTRLQVLLVFGAVFFLQLIAYREAIRIRPSADDFILPGQIRLGEVNGPLIFFKASPLNDYRPLQSVAYWAVGRWQMDDPFPLIHVLNFSSFVFFAAVVALWTMLLRMSLGGVVCVALLLSLHPILAGPLADLDGFTRMVVSGLVWLGTLAAVRFSGNLRIAVPLVAACFVVGLGFMEYALGLVPLSVLALWWSRRDRRWFAAATLAAVLLVLFAGYYLARVSVLGSGASRLTSNPLEWIRNFALLLSGVGFMGSTVWVYFHPGAKSLALLGASVTLLGVLILAGLGLRYRNPEPAEAGRTAFPTLSREAGFLVTAFLASFTPMVLMSHVSEIYATAILVPLALAAGRAAEGWSRASRPLALAAGVVFASLLAWGFLSAESKVAQLRDSGDRATIQLEQLLRWLRPEDRQQKVALVFLNRELPKLRTYSVFRAGDDHLLQPGAGIRAAIEWTRPGSGHVVKHLIVPERSQVDPAGFDLVLHWNPESRQFENWK